MTVSINHRTVVFRGTTAAAVNVMQAQIERLVAKPSTIKWSDKAKPSHSGHAAVTMFHATDVSSDVLEELEMLRPTAVFKGNCEVVRRQVNTFCQAQQKDAPVILWSWVDGSTHITEVYAYIPAWLIGEAYAGDYNQLPAVVNRALMRMSDLYHGYRGYGDEERTQLSRKLSRHVNGLLAMDAEALAAWHNDSLRLIAEVEKTAIRLH